MAGIVLAGGLSSRFGSPKAFAEWGNRHFYELSLQALSPFCENNVIVTRPELVERFPDELIVTTDIAEFAGQGPVAGILSGMQKIKADRYIVLPCDMPFMTADVIKRLFECHSSGVTAVVLDGKYHPLVSVWDKTVLLDLQEALENGRRRVMDVQEKHGVRWIEGELLTEDDAERVFMNANTPTFWKGVVDNGTDC
ncbi:molybdenum cofactor guanylyltransferase [Sporosarcina highlanderae]|uniref:Probable molybdenum cofactor guanylyltransferase n=1 Tax=Sporosarcina highlanderae TaxID=3035916 RepID=A0ABT8JM21_9BACL|nr:molybdenum cofactor guanylyltransferase [Sporosarcina highlanderae]MDN4606120.1 molybdenum cofactor guanylyltransferase [Sporosarcina highlanderae]